MSSELLTVQSVAERLHVSKSRVYALVAAGQLPAVRLGPRLTRIAPESLDTFIRDREVPVAS